MKSKRCGGVPQQSAIEMKVRKRRDAGRPYVHQLSVLERLRNNRMLDSDEHTATMLFVAGLAFGDWMWGDPAVNAIRAIDPAKIKVDASGFNNHLDHLLDQESVRKRYRDVFRNLERETFRVLTLIIIHNMSIEDVTAEIYGRDERGGVRKLHAQEVRSTLRFGLRQIATWLRIPGYLKS